jgi:hypothetical protein
VKDAGEALSKICTKCKKELPATEEFFFKGRGKCGFQAWCRTCRNEFRSLYGKANRDKLNAQHKEWLRPHGGSASYRHGLYSERLTALDVLKDFPCLDCGERFPPIAMDFDHVRGEKTKSISYLVRNSTWEAVLKEIAKCDLVCANCHRVRTSERGESRNLTYREEVVGICRT